MSSNDSQVLRMTSEQIQDAIRESLENSEIQDYSFEERYCRGVERVVRPKQDELDRLHYMRLETIVSKKEWEIFSVFTNNCYAHPNKVACVWLDGDGKEEARWTYSELLERARVIAAHLKQDYGLEKGDRVLLVYEPGIDFFATFWACVGTGIISVPVCPPDPFNPDNDATDKLVAIWRDASPKLILTTRKYKDSLAAARTFLGAKFEAVMAASDHVLDPARVLWIATNDLTFVAQSEWAFTDPEVMGMSEEDTVFLQYTSGSTGGAKGVEVQHRALGANCINCALLTQGMGSLYVYQFSLGVSWLPTFHDMGLIGFHVAPMLIGGSMVYFSPLDFIQNPVMWLKVVSRFKHVSSGAPPFALDLCSRRVTPAELQQLDLSGLEVLVLGAEPIRASYMEQFTRAFQAYGFNPKAYMTCFGMAENILHVAGKWSNQYEARKILVDSHQLNENTLAVYKDLIVSSADSREHEYYTAKPALMAPGSHEDRDCQWLVSSGELVPFNCEVTVDAEQHMTDALRNRKAHFYRREVASYVTIVNPDTLEECPDGTVGEVWICGPSKTKGYFNKPEVNARNFKAKLAKAVKADTQALIRFAAKIGREPPTRDNLNTYSAQELAEAREPLFKLMRFCLDSRGEVEWLRSGDMAVVHDGNLFITGRIKDMIIIRGQNFYADDLEHAVTGGKAAVDVADGAAKGLSSNPALVPLGFLRPGSAIAYSLTVGSDGSADCPARRAKAEGEHVCVMVELASDVTEDCEEEEADDDADVAADRKFGSTAPKPEGKSLTKAKKHGDQMPVWQRFLLKYGGDLVSGMSRVYEEKEQQLLQRATNGRARTQRRSLGCTARAKLLMQQAFLGSIRLGISAAGTAIKTLNPEQEPEAEAGAAASPQPAAIPSLQRHRAPDAETLAVRARYSEQQLDTICSAVRTAVSLKFMVQVSQVVLLAPRSVKKTSSGKKRRADMVKAVEDGFLDHRIVRRSYTRALKEYTRLKAQPENQKAKSPTAVAAATAGVTPVKLAGVAAAALRTMQDTAPPASVLAMHLPQPAPVTVNMAVTGGTPRAAAHTPQYGGTVGVSLGDGQDAYDTSRRTAGASLVPQGARQLEDVTAAPLLPPVSADAAGARDEEAKRGALAVVESLEAAAAELTFAAAKPRILRVVCREVNAAQGNEELTEEFLQTMSTKSTAEQQQELDEFGLDSMTGFKLAKSLAEEFSLPSSMMGPHLFVRDPTLDGMVGVMVQLVALQATKAREEFKERFETVHAAPAGAAAAYDTTAHVFRGTTDERRIPYVLGIGTAVPFNCAPQSEVIQAMLGPMKMNKKSEERFLKIAENSGVGTRYSALDSLDGLFWGKEGVNQGQDEYVDARHEVYKREAVKLSIASAADCLRDWQGSRVPLNDEQRETQRLERYLAVDKKHREAKVAKKALAAEAAKAAKATGKATGKAKDAGAAPEPEQSTAVTAEQAIAAATTELGDLRGLAGEVQTQTGRAITHVVAVTCTGVIVPGLEFHIMQALGLPLNTQRLSIQFMGCFGAVSGLRCASSLAAEHPRNRVLVVCTELCTLHMQLNDKVDNLVATALFADGSGAFVVGCDPTPAERPLYAIESCSSLVIPSTLDQMAWDLKKNGLHIGLAKEIAGEIFHHIGDFVGDLLQHAPDAANPRHRVAAQDCNCAIHPGGPLILNTIQNVLGIEQVGDGHGGGEMDPAAPTLEAWEILREYGNMSSATLVFVLDRIREKKHREGKWTPVVAFGPGLSIEGSLLKAVFKAPQADGTYPPRIAAAQTNTTQAKAEPPHTEVAANIQRMTGTEALVQRM